MIKNKIPKFNKIEIKLYNYGTMYYSRVFTRDQYEEAQKFFTDHYYNNDIATIIFIDGKEIKFNDYKKYFNTRSFNRYF